MTGRHLRRRSPAFWLVPVAVGALVAVAGFVVTERPARPSRPPSAAVQQPSATSLVRSGVAVTVHASTGGLPALPRGPTGPAHSAASPSADVSPPTRLTISAIGVDTSLEALGLLPDGTLQAPSQWGEAGWYAAGVRPGDRGPAVIAGHVDSVNGPAVFYRLRELQPGAVALVRLRNGAALRFVVDSVRSFPKTSFPTDAVYGPTALPELRLITCTGDFDRSALSYRNNLVVSAHLA